jgi:endonuclease YncB( thermonuclease family)
MCRRLSVGILIAGALLVAAAAVAHAQPPVLGYVTRVVDGDTSYAEYFRALEGQARTATRGLWATVAVATPDQAQASLPGAKSADSTAGAPSIQSSPLPGGAPSARSSSDRTPYVQPSTRSDGTAVGGYYRGPARR